MPRGISLRTRRDARRVRRAVRRSEAGRRGYRPRKAPEVFNDREGAAAAEAYKAVLGKVSCYLGNGWYRITPLEMADPDYPGKDLLNGVSPCKSSGGTTYTWDEATESWGGTDNCGSGCSSAEPGGDGDFDGQTCFEPCESDGACTGNATWTWTQYGGGSPGDPDDWVETTPCTGSHCAAPKPTSPGSTYSETTTTPCQRNTMCEHNYDDPASLCEVAQSCPPRDPDSVVDRQAGTGSTGWVLAYQVSKLTLTTNTQVLLIPYTSPTQWSTPKSVKWSSDCPAWAQHSADCYQIVTAALPLNLVFVPTTISCCDGSPKITAFSTMIVEGLSCGSYTDPCPE